MSEGGVVRVLLADDHTLVRAGVRHILESQSGVTVVGEVGDGSAALEALANTPVDVLVLDLSMPGLDGFAVLRRARALAPALKVLVLSMHADQEYVSRAVREGADGYLLKDSAVDDLMTAIEAVREGRPFYSPRIQRQLTDLVRGGPSPGSPLAPLTEREREVLKRIAEGQSTKEIAARLEISTRTVETHRANMMRKLEVRSLAQLVRLAIREGLVDAP
ncbi:MAG TPA: response regulator transcription factor [Candidatus Eisenbacteria bacterium]|jgi:DNA-binding NarL/FixJ family response regulator